MAVSDLELKTRHHYSFGALIKLLNKKKEDLLFIEVRVELTSPTWSRIKIAVDVF